MRLFKLKAACNRTEIREQIQKLETVVSSLLGNATHSEEYLHQQLTLFRPAAAPDISDDEFKTVLRRLSNRLSIDVEMGARRSSP